MPLSLQQQCCQTSLWGLTSQATGMYSSLVPPVDLYRVVAPGAMCL